MYGHVVSGYGGSAYLIPAYQILRDIQQELGNPVQFMDTQRLKSLRGQPVDDRDQRREDAEGKGKVPVEDSNGDLRNEAVDILDNAYLQAQGDEVPWKTGTNNVQLESFAKFNSEFMDTSIISPSRSASRRHRSGRYPQQTVIEHWPAIPKIPNSPNGEYRRPSSAYVPEDPRMQPIMDPVVAAYEANKAESTAERNGSIPYGQTIPPLVGETFDDRSRCTVEHRREDYISSASFESQQSVQPQNSWDPTQAMQSQEMASFAPLPLIMQAIYRTPCSWQTCTESFTRINDLKRHIQSVHLGVRYHCYWTGCADNAGRGYARTESLRTHQRQKHGIESGIDTVPGQTPPNLTSRVQDSTPSFQSPIDEDEHRGYSDDLRRRLDEAISRGPC